MKAYLQQLANKQSFDETTMKEAVRMLFSDETTDSEIAAFLMGLQMKGETVEEITGLVHTLRDHALPFQHQCAGVMDNCGTGGDGSQSFNISTTSAFVVAGAGVTVAKHGNRSISSKTGSADVLEQLGVSLQLPPEATLKCLQEVGICFLYAPHVHPKVGRIMSVRRDLKVPTIFNLIGPLTNPVSLDYQLVGTYRKDMLTTFGHVLRNLGRKRAVVVSGAGAMDEASLAGENYLVKVEAGKIEEWTLRPADVGLPTYPNEKIQGGDSVRNVEILRNVLEGERGAYRDTVLLNAGIAIYTSSQAGSVEEGIDKARWSIDSGAAKSTLESLIEFGNTYNKEAVK